MKTLYTTMAVMVVAGLVGEAMADSVIPDRRRSQFQNDPGYAAVPYVYNLPGVGSGYGLLGAVNNIAGSYTDVAATYFGGDVTGEAVGVNSLHLIHERLILDVGGVSLDRAAVQSYSQRGMTTSRDDYITAEFQNMLGLAGRLTATFADRRYEAFVACYGNHSRLDALRDKDGNLITTATDASATWTDSLVAGGRLDWTDDYMDPRRGVRFEPSAWWSPPSGEGANYVFIDNSLSGYIPLGKQSTWAFNGLTSDAIVMEEGETDPQRLAAKDGLTYDALSDPREREFIDSQAAANRYGNATSLGGVSRLRSYPESRYRGAHSQFVGTEIRWNLTDEMKPFNLILIKDVRTAIQIAPFYELGTTADRYGDLWSHIRDSYGVGVRIVTASGLIYRFDLAAGAEGIQPSIFFQYPWEL